MLTYDAFTRDMLAEAIRRSVDAVVQKHINRLSQEPQITSKIADRLEQDIASLRISGFRITVVAQDMPDRGRGALEKRTGADLYFAIRVQDELLNTDISKALLIQSKFDRIGTKSQQGDLVSACERMVEKSPKGAYVWLYGQYGVRSVPASEVMSFPLIPADDLGTRNVAEQMRDVLDCVAGDQQIVTPEVFTDTAALNEMMRKIGAHTGVAVALARSKEPAP